jgi:NHLM bacteriocin system ABC transporter ATP-binding protein
MSGLFDRPSFALDADELPDWFMVRRLPVELYAQPLAGGMPAGPRRYLGNLPEGTLLPRSLAHPRWRLWIVTGEPGNLEGHAWPQPGDGALAPASAERHALHLAPLIRLLQAADSPPPNSTNANSALDTVALLAAAGPGQAMRAWLHARLDALNERRVPLDAAAAAEVAHQARQSALLRMAEVLDSDAAPARKSDHSLAALASRVARTQGIVLPDAADKAQPGETIEHWAYRANVRLRKVALRESWWRADGAALLAFREDDKTPVALLPAPGHGYRTVEQDGPPLAVGEDLAHALTPFAYSLHGRLPDAPLSFADMLGFGWRGAVGDSLIMLAATLTAGLLGAALPAAIAYVFQTIIPSAEPRLLSQLVMAILMLTFLASLLQLTSDLASLRIEGRLGNGLQSAFFDRLLRLPVSFFDTLASGDLSNRMATVDMVRRSFARVITQLTTSLFYTLGAFATMMYYMPKAAWIAGSLLLVLWAAAGYLGWRQVRSLYEGEQMEGNIVSLAVQLIQGIPKLRLAGAEDRAFGLWGRAFAEMRARLVRSQSVQAHFAVVLAVVEVALTATVFAVLGYSDGDKPTTGEFLALVAALATFSGSGLSLGQAIVAAITLKPFAERARPLMRAEPERGSSGGTPHDIRGGVEVVQLSFRYGDTGAWALRNVSFAAKPGEFIAVVGESGSGKSTLMRLLMAFEKPVSGGVFFDGRDLAGLDAMALRRQIGVVLQNARTMPGTLFENISIAHDCSLDDAWQAVRMAGLEEDIRAMPMGMHTVLSEGNAALSGGQVQRLLLARAIAGKPRMLLLDEATSALDNRTQAAVTAALDGLSATRIVIAHRLSTVRNADRILVMHEGQIVESGTHEELMQMNGYFTRLARRQLT